MSQPDPTNPQPPHFPPPPYASITAGADMVEDEQVMIRLRLAMDEPNRDAAKGVEATTTEAMIMGFEVRSGMAVHRPGIDVAV